MDPKVATWTKKFFNAKKIGDEPILRNSGIWKEWESGIDRKTWDRNVVNGKAEKSDNT